MKINTYCSKYETKMIYTRQEEIDLEAVNNSLIILRIYCLPVKYIMNIIITTNCIIVPIYNHNFSCYVTNLFAKKKIHLSAKVNKKDMCDLKLVLYSQLIENA